MLRCGKSRQCCFDVTKIYQINFLYRRASYLDTSIFVVSPGGLIFTLLEFFSNDVTREERGDAGYDFIVDGFCGGGDFFGCDPFFFLGAEEHDFVFGSGVLKMGYVDGKHVHGDAAEYRAARAMDEYRSDIGESAVITIAVALGDDGDGGFFAGDIGEPVTDRVSGGKGFDLGDMGYPAEYWLQLEAGGFKGSA